MKLDFGGEKKGNTEKKSITITNGEDVTEKLSFLIIYISIQWVLNYVDIIYFEVLVADMRKIWCQKRYFFQTSAQRASVSFVGILDGGLFMLWPICRVDTTVSPYISFGVFCPVWGWSLKCSPVVMRLFYGWVIDKKKRVGFKRNTKTYWVSRKNNGHRGEYYTPDLTMKRNKYDKMVF